MALSLISGFVVKLVARSMAKKGYAEEEVTWDNEK